MSRGGIDTVSQVHRYFPTLIPRRCLRCGDTWWWRYGLRMDANSWNTRSIWMLWYYGCPRCYAPSSYRHRREFRALVWAAHDAKLRRKYQMDD